MTSQIHLFLAPGACSLAPHILLREAGLSFTTTSMDVRAAFPSQYLHVNPKGRVPILQLDSSTITETPAIMTAIAQLASSKNLLGATALDTVRCYEWMNWLSGSLHGQGFGGLFRPERLVDSEELYGVVRKKAWSTIQEGFTFIEEKLEGKTWAVGEAFSAVDAYLLVFYRWGSSNGLNMRETYPNYTAVMERVGEREAVVQTAKAEGIEIFP